MNALHSSDWIRVLQIFIAVPVGASMIALAVYLHRMYSPRRRRLPGDFQSLVHEWAVSCFGKKHAEDIKIRNWRFFEESAELCQSTGMTREDAHELVEYVYNRPIGEPRQEVGGVMVTLAALCEANGIEMHKAGYVELSRVWLSIEAIRAKQARKKNDSALPGPSEESSPC